MENLLCSAPAMLLCSSLSVIYTLLILNMEKGKWSRPRIIRSLLFMVLVVAILQVGNALRRIYQSFSQGATISQCGVWPPAN